MSVRNNTIDKLTDRQKSLLTQFAYINYDIEKYRESIKNEKMSIVDLEKILAYKGHTHKVQRFCTRALAKAGNIVKSAYEKLNRSLGLEQKEIKALPEGKKQINIREDYTLENFKTEDKTFDKKQARENLLMIEKEEKEMKGIKNNKEKKVESK